MIKRKQKITTAVFIVFFLNMMITTICIGYVYSTVIGIDLIDDNEKRGVRILLLVIPLITQFILSRILVQGPLKKIIEFNKALKSVKDGNFNITLNNDTNVIEINELADTFNSMTEELTNTEMFRNDFISNVSHEFKTPLAAIEGYATLLQNSNLSEEKKQVYREKILYNTKRLSALTGNILMLSNLENQNIEIKKEYFDIDEQIRESILLFENQWENKNLNMEIDLEELKYYGNREMLSQVWQNIIGNAIKFVDSEGTIKIVLEKEDLCIRVSIIDNGIGMNEKTKRRVFEKFYQGDTSHAEEGNGLGLNIAKKIVDLHNGEIVIESELNKGTSFIIKFPLNTVLV